MAMKMEDKIFSSPSAARIGNITPSTLESMGKTVRVLEIWSHAVITLTGQDRTNAMTNGYSMICGMLADCIELLLLFETYITITDAKLFAGRGNPDNLPIAVWKIQYMTETKELSEAYGWLEKVDEYRKSMCKILTRVYREKGPEFDRVTLENPATKHEQWILGGGNLNGRRLYALLSR